MSGAQAQNCGPGLPGSGPLAGNIHTLELLERMIALMEQRRNAAYHQAEQRRVNLGNRLRQVVTQVEDAEFRELDDQPKEQKRVA